MINYFDFHFWTDKKELKKLNVWYTKNSARPVACHTIS